MDFQSLIEQYGYIVITIGAFFEGETILVVGGYLAHDGTLELPWVILSAFVGTIFGDQLYFYIGRHKGMPWIEEHPKWQARTKKIFKYLHKNQTLFILSFRFIYGIRSVAPFVIGASGVSRLKYTLLNLVSAVIWAISVGYLGYAVGQIAMHYLQDIKKYEYWIIGLIFLISMVVWFYYRGKNKKEIDNL